MEIPYIRVGTTYYKFINKPLISGDTVRIMTIWNYQTIKLDHGEAYLKKVPKYDALCCIPNHMKYERVVKNHLNIYEPLPHKPQKGDKETTLKFINHIFGEHYHLGLDYLTILYRFPQQTLPVLCLVSEERNTGKTTFLNFLKLLFGRNMTQNTNEDFRSQFNSDWAGKLIIAVDEVLLERREDSERIKHLSTARSYKTEAKGKDREEIEFFSKFIMCSNDEERFVKIDPREVRYWVLKVPRFESENVNLLEDLKSEVPAILDHLSTRDIITKCSTRMWFNPKEIRTAALAKLMKSNMPQLESEMLQILRDILDKYELDEIKVCPGDLIGFLKFSNIRADLVKVRNVLNSKWGFKCQSNSNSYTRYAISTDGVIYTITSAKGRYYTIDLASIDDLMNNGYNYQ